MLLVYVVACTFNLNCMHAHTRDDVETRGPKTEKGVPILTRIRAERLPHGLQSQQHKQTSNGRHAGRASTREPCAVICARARGVSLSLRRLDGSCAAKAFVNRDQDGCGIGARQLEAYKQPQSSV